MTSKVIADHEAHGPWRKLLSLASRLVSQVEGLAGTPMKPLLGGGTRLMLTLHHRISDDIDLFIRDPQWIGYLTPRLNDKTEAAVDGYEENAVSLKLKVAQGEIDFIVAMSLLNLPNEKIPGVPFDLEPVAEVLAKKLFYRGAMLTPRDLYDWWAIETMAPNELPRAALAALIKDRLAGIESTLDAMSVSKAAQSIWMTLRAPKKPPLIEAIEFARQRINDYRHGIDVSPTPCP
ncbi:MAG TPA: nucleotidyl transferase AbiEii/AbiGii toxin family protein [Steroidobacter sp.]|nr:nucleotidyl transferase AbiEii/AbiGii toxin family protein [Steroidobacter sp.]